MVSRAKYAPIKYKDSKIESESAYDLFRLFKGLNKKIENDNVDQCDYDNGMATNIIKISEISNELSKRNLSKTEKLMFNSETNKFDKLLTEFGLFCYCIEGKDPKKREQWEKDFAERHSDKGIVLTDEFFKTAEKLRDALNKEIKSKTMFIG